MAPSSYFSASYAEAREKFRGGAATVGARLTTHPHPARGPHGEELATEIARLGPAEAPRVLVTLSATHGVEGFCGSALQTGWFESGLAREMPPQTALVAIHAINPYGFAWLRRVTEENVDLNRNFVDFSKPLPQNPAYDALHDFACPREWTEESRAAADAVLAAYAERHGAAAFQLAVSGGQYSHPDGIFYGGIRAAWSRHTLTGILTRELASARQVAIVDLHTGLGPYGHGEAITTYRPGSAGFERAREWYGDRVTSTAAGSSSSADVVGDCLVGIEEAFPGITQTGITLEFGTVPLREVFDAIRADNWLHRHGTLDSPAGHAIKEQIRAAFYCDRADWKSMLFEQGSLVLRQALKGLTGEL